MPRFDLDILGVLCVTTISSLILSSPSNSLQNILSEFDEFPTRCKASSQSIPDRAACSYLLPASALRCSNRFQQVPTGSNRFQQVPTGSNRFQQVPTGSNRFQQSAFWCCQICQCVVSTCFTLFQRHVTVFKRFQTRLTAGLMRIEEFLATPTKISQRHMATSFATSAMAHIDKEAHSYTLKPV